MTSWPRPCHLDQRPHRTHGRPGPYGRSATRCIPGGLRGPWANFTPRRFLRSLLQTDAELRRALEAEGAIGHVKTLAEESD